MKTKAPNLTKTSYFLSSNYIFWFGNISINNIYTNVNATISTRLQQEFKLENRKSGRKHQVIASKHLRYPEFSPTLGNVCLSVL